MKWILTVNYLLFASLAFGQTSHTEQFQQEIATVFTENDGLPAIAVNEIRLNQQDQPIAITRKGDFIFEKGTWQSYSQAIPPPIKPQKPVIPGIKACQWDLTQADLTYTDKKNRTWVAVKPGLAMYENGKWIYFTGKEGLPYQAFTCIAEEPDGDIWLGTSTGAIRADGQQFYYRASRRWLPDDHVRDIAIQQNGTVWIATQKGISRIAYEQMNYEQKAAVFIQQVENRHVRDGFVCQSKLTRQFDVSSSINDISDNDGLYTAMYGAAQAFRFAVTGDKEAKVLADRSLKACKWLVDITHEPGFPARVIIPIDWHEDVNAHYDSLYNARRRERDPFWKLILPRFVKSKDGKYLWKCDTSSDELAGHYFFYAIYYDLVAQTSEEKQMVREVVADITNHLIRNGFYLRDHDGKATRWGNFSPEFLNSIWGWDQRGLNSMMMLSFLKVAEHVTGDSKYTVAAQMLMDKHQYHINAMLSKAFFPPDDVVPWDNNLCLMSFYGLMKYEKDPERLMMYRESLEFAWLHISKQNNALWNIIYAALSAHFNEVVKSGIYETGEVFPEAGPYATHTAKEFSGSDFHYDKTIETLRILPLDLIGYEIDNTHRLDVVFDPTPGADPTHGWHVDGFALPINERGHVRQDRDAYALKANEGNGFTEHEGTFYLLPYYMARFHGLIR